MYGKPNTVAFREDAYCFPVGFYSITKKAAEDLVVDYCKTFKIKYRILRLSNIYGSLAAPEKLSNNRNFLHNSIESLRNNKPVVVFKGVKRDCLHVYDACRAINTVIEKGEYNSIYNIGANAAYPYEELLSYAKNILGSTGLIAEVDAPDSYEQALYFFLGCNRLHSLGFYPMIDIHEGIKDLCLDQSSVLRTVF